MWKRHFENDVQYLNRKFQHCLWPSSNDQVDRSCGQGMLVRAMYCLSGYI
jgi:hypothetical protein